MISTEKRNNYIKFFVEKIKKDFQTEIKENGINTYEFPVFHDAYRAYMTDEQLDKSHERALNAVACINNYTPASINELIRNNEAFQKEDI